MQKYRGREQPGGNIAPIHHLVERIELTGVMETGKDKARQAEHQEVQGFGSMGGQVHAVA